MALDTYEDVWRSVKQHVPKADVNLARLWVRNGFRELAERRRWSWLIREGQWILPVSYTTGTVTVTQNSPNVTGASTVWTAAMEGRQFRVGTGQIYTINSINTSAQTLVLDRNYGDAGGGGKTYSIYQAYVTAPNDFLTMLTAVSMSDRWRLHLHIHSDELDRRDSARENSGSPYILASRTYSTNRVGVVYPVIQAVGTGPDPTAVTPGSYTGIDDAIFVVEVTTGGTVTNAIFKWKKDGGSYTTGVVTSASAQTLQEGVQIYWPASVTYTSGDVFLVRVTSASAPGRPRYEVWPHVKTEKVINFLYVARPTDLNDDGAALPYAVPGSTVLEFALAAAARWPGPTVQDRNPYFQINLENRHTQRAEQQLSNLERQDNEIYESDTMYQDWDYAPIGPIDAKWMQSHL